MAIERKLTSLVYYDLRNQQVRPMASPIDPVVLCLGNFDGVHTAHASLLRQGLALRDQQLPQGLCGVFTFWCPSSDYLRISVDEGGISQRSILKKANKHEHLTTLTEKMRLLAEIGIDFICLCDFEEICGWSPEVFLNFLTIDLKAHGVVCGFNYRFGSGGRGTSNTITAHFSRPNQGFFCHVAPPFCVDGQTVSSTRIRQLLLAGDVETATAYLGHPYTLESEVVKGKQLGRKLGFPTANQYFSAESLVPAHGVYAVLCHTPEGIFPGVANVGSHPTVDDDAKVNCETYVIGTSQNLYGHQMRVEFLSYLRPETQFPSVEALTEAISHDAARAKAYIQSYLSSQ